MEESIDLTEYFGREFSNNQKQVLQEFLKGIDTRVFVHSKLFSLIKSRKEAIAALELINWNIQESIKDKYILQKRINLAALYLEDDKIII